MTRVRSARHLPDPGLDALDRGLRLLALPVVAAVVGALVATALLPLAGGAGRAVRTFDARFIPDERAPLRIGTFPQRSTIYAADGSVLARLAEFNRVLVPLDRVPEVARQAVLAIEDHGFYEHGPVDFSSILRALIANIRAGQVVQGASTIAQQLVKNTQTGSERTFARKWRELQDAIRLERTYTKDQILEFYLNDVYFGHGTYGIGTASEYYFGKGVSKLTLPEAALLAGIIQRPAQWDPIRRRKDALRRRNVVLRRMLELGWISEDRYLAAVTAPIKLSRKLRDVNRPGPQPYFVQFVKDTILHPLKTDPNYRAIVKIFGKTVEQRARSLYRGGFRIYTTLDPEMQAAAERAVEARLPDQGNPYTGNPEAALTAVVPSTGAIRAMYGGPDFRHHKINLAVQSRRQAGSAFKAFTLVAALEEGVPVGKVYPTPNPVTIPQSKCINSGGPWRPANAEPGSGGFMDMATATADSVNVWFAQLIADVGPANVQQAAEEMGVAPYAYNSVVRIPALCAITLGSVEVNPLAMTAGYATLANQGVRCYPFAIQRIVNAKGKTVFRARPHCQQVIDPKVAAQVTALLEGVITHGTGTAANIGRPAAGKTGTAQEFTDAWFMGYVPQLVAGVWVGYGYLNRQVSLLGAPILTTGALAGRHPYGGTLAAPIWHDFMIRAVAGMPVEGFPAPPAPKAGRVPDVVGKKVDRATAILARANFTAVVQEVPSTEPAGVVVAQDPPGGASAPLGSPVTIQVSNGKAPKAVVPNVVGLTEAEARARLTGRGFRVKVVEQPTGPEQDGIVLDQSPKPGTKLAQGSAVTIVVGKKQAGPGGGPGA